MGINNIIILYTLNRCIFGELITSQPLFRGEGEIGQLLKIFKILGSPSKEDLLEMNNKSQYFRDVKIPKYPDQLKQTLQQYGKHVFYFIL